MLITDDSTDMVEYQGRLVEREHFRVFVFAKDKEPRLIDDYEEYKKLIKSKKWSDKPVKEK